MHDLETPWLQPEALDNVVLASPPGPLPEPTQAPRAQLEHEEQAWAHRERAQTPLYEQDPLTAGFDGSAELFLPPSPSGDRHRDPSELEFGEVTPAELEDLMTAELEGLDEFELLHEVEDDLSVAPAFERQLVAPGAAQNQVATTVEFSIRTDFSVSAAGRLTFDWIAGEAVAGAEVAVVGHPNLRAVSDAQGRARIDVATLADGDYVARITHSIADRATTHSAGPQVADHLTTRPSRIYRQLDLRIRVRNRGIESAWVAASDTHGGIGNRSRAAVSRLHVPIDWRPVWMQSPMKPTEHMRTAPSIDTIVVHHTGGPKIGPAINTFFNGADAGNAHYVIDRNGHVVKTAEDLRRANHAGISRWAGRLGVSGPSIGIEIVHRDGPYPAAQMASLLTLIRSLRTAYPTIPRRAIVGHTDIATAKGNPTLLSNRRPEDPGIEFDWRLLEDQGLGMLPLGLAVLPSMVSSWFRGAAPVLRRNDSDPSGTTPAVLGGHRQPGFTGTPVREVQQDLERIGYSCRPQSGPFGTYDLHTERAVDRFQRHFFAGSRQQLRAGRLGRVDPLTALWIKAVRAGVP